MASARPEEIELLRKLYAGATDPQDGFAGVLAHLAAITRADMAALRGVAPSGPAWIRSVARVNHAAGWLLDQSELASWLDGLRPERVHDGEDLRAAMVLPGTLRLRAMRLRVGADGDSAWIMILRDGDEFRAIDAVWLSVLAPHLPQAISAARRLAAERRTAALHRDIAARLSAGWIGFDATGRVCGHDGTAARLLGTAGVRLEPGQRLGGHNADTDARLSAAFRRLAEPPHAPQAVLLRAAPALGLGLAPARAQTTGASIVGHLQSAPCGTVPVARLHQMWGLTRAEARLALALARGHSLSEAAAVLGLTVETARSYSRAIYARTGWRGQPDLIRAMLTSGLWLGPPDDGAA